MTPSNADSTGRTTHLTQTAGRSTDGAMAAMWAGLLLTVVATLAPYVDRVSGHVLADHIRDGYPRYGPERVGHAVTAWLVLLTAAGVLGILGWAGSMWAVRVDMAWARWTATSMFVAGTAVALTALLTKDTSGEVGLAPLLGWLGMLPSGAGLVTVGLLWRTRPAAARRPRVIPMSRPLRSRDTDFPCGCHGVLAEAGLADNTR